MTISPALNVISLSSAASKSYNALAFFSSSFLTEGPEDDEEDIGVDELAAAPPEYKLSDG